MEHATPNHLLRLRLLCRSKDHLQDCFPFLGLVLATTTLGKAAFAGAVAVTNEQVAAASCDGATAAAMSRREHLDAAGVGATRGVVVLLAGSVLLAKRCGRNSSRSAWRKV